MEIINIIFYLCSKSSKEAASLIIIMGEPLGIHVSSTRLSTIIHPETIKHIFVHFSNIRDVKESYRGYAKSKLYKFISAKMLNGLML